MVSGMPEYDRTITMFSPDGRLLQVEYAKKTVSQGSTAVGIVCKNGVVLAADKRIMHKLIVPNSVEKITKIDKHIAVASAGIISDGRILIERMQYLAQEHRFTYDTPIDILVLVREIADIKQAYTQSGGVRPFGVALMIAGYDLQGPQLYVTDPTGIYFKYYAKAIGEKEKEIDNLLIKEYKQNIKLEEGIKLALNALKDALKQEFKVERIALTTINKNGINNYTVEEIRKYIKE